MRNLGHAQGTAQTGLAEIMRLARSRDESHVHEAAAVLAVLAQREENQYRFLDEGGLQLLVRLGRSKNKDICRYSILALASLACFRSNRYEIIEEGGLTLLIRMVRNSTDPETRRLACHAIANLAVNAENKSRIVEEGAGRPLINAAAEDEFPELQLEALAALANLAVNDDNERLLAKDGAIPVIVSHLNSPNNEILREAARAAVNFSVNENNKLRMIDAGAVQQLQHLAKDKLNRKLYLLSSRALINLRTMVCADGNVLKTYADDEKKVDNKAQLPAKPESDYDAYWGFSEDMAEKFGVSGGNTNNPLLQQLN